MKKFFVAILLIALIAPFSFPKKLKFMGLPINEPIEKKVDFLKEKGFSLTKETSELIVFKGNFWKFNDCSFMLSPKDNDISVNIGLNTDSDLISQLMEVLDNKYGENIFKYDEKNKYLLCFWKLEDGAIELLAANIGQMMYLLKYYPKDKAKKRYNEMYNQDDDL